MVGKLSGTYQVVCANAKDGTERIKAIMIMERMIRLPSKWVVPYAIPGAVFEGVRLVSLRPCIISDVGIIKKANRIFEKGVEVVTTGLVTGRMYNGQFAITERQLRPVLGMVRWSKQEARIREGHGLS